MNLALAGVTIEIVAMDSELQQLLGTNFSHLVTSQQPSALSYHLEQTKEGYIVHSPDRVLYCGNDLADVLFYLEKDLIISVQLKSSDKLFFHAAALTFRGKTLLFAGASGAGKSSLCWALLQHAFKYLSDELVPVLPGQKVYPFQRAVNLKRALAPPYGLSDSAIDLGRFYILPVEKSNLEENIPEKIDYIFLVQFDPQAQMPEVSGISGADAMILLYQHVLNAGAFSDFGLKSLAQVVGTAHSYQLRSVRDVQATVDLISRLVSSGNV